MPFFKQVYITMKLIALIQHLQEIRHRSEIGIPDAHDDVHLRIEPRHPLWGLITLEVVWGLLHHYEAVGGRAEVVQVPSAA